MMLGVDPEIAISTLRLWVAAGAGALLAACCVLACVLPRGSTGAMVRVGFVVLGVAVGAAMVWAFAPAGQTDAERRALELRAQELVAQSLAPGSPLACLNGVVGDNVEAACEREIFASPESVAATISYTAARLTLLSDLSAHVARGGADLNDLLMPLRRSLEADRFGFLAHVLAVREGCTSEQCRGLALLHDAGLVRANLADATLDRYLDHYRPLWAKSTDGSLAETTQVEPNAARRFRVQPSRMVDIDFPSASSIPPISIMNPEPKGPVLPGVAAAAATNPNPRSAASSSRRPRRQTPNAPVSAAPPAVPATVEPIWPEPVPPPPPSGSSGAARGQ